MSLERKPYLRAALILGLSGISWACTGYIEPSPSRGPAAKLDSGTTSAEPARAGDAQTAGSSAPLGVLATSTGVPVWSGAVGTWCGPAESRTLWLTAQPLAQACDVTSQQLDSDASAPKAEGLTFRLDAALLTQLPQRLNLTARYCPAGGASCSDVTTTLDVESFTPAVGISGAWSFTLPGQPTQAGRIDAGWCDFDAFLPAHPDAERLARDIRIREVAAYQGVKVPLARDGSALPTRNADLVQQREALLRVFVEPAPGFVSRELSARLTLQDAGKKPRFFEQTATISGASTDADGASTFNLVLPKDAFEEGTQYSVELRETSRCTELTGTPVGARFPEQGLTPVGARATGPIKVMLVPVRYEADGSGRLPDTSAAQLAAMTKRLYSMYPTTGVTLSVRDVVGTDRTELTDMLDQMRELRSTDAPPSDLSYYGMVRQAETFDDYCQGTCTTGIAGFGSQNGTCSAGMGVGYAGSAAGTFVHELGHIYRRPHAPCGGAAGADDSYPYPVASLGSWGYDVQTHELFDPQKHVDFMSYCAPDWISDYSYQQILERIVVVNQLAPLRRIGAPREFRTLRVAEDGQARWGLDLQSQLQPPGDPIDVEALDESGAVLEVVSAYVEVGADAERAYFVPAGHSGWHAIRVPGAAAVSYAAATQNTPFRR